jgi:hypothetical protein
MGLGRANVEEWSVMSLNRPGRRLPGIMLFIAAIAVAAAFPAGGATLMRGQAGPLARLTYPPGWNLVGGPAGMVLAGADGPLYTYQAGDREYRLVPADTPLEAGAGYWAHFETLAVQTLPASAPLNTTLALPAGAYVMIGNPRATISAFYGAHVVYIYDAVQGYQTTLTLQPGQGAWAYSARGATITIANIAP